MHRVSHKVDGQFPPESAPAPWAENPSEEMAESRPASSLKANERRVSRTDADAALVTGHVMTPFMGYKVHISIDGGRARVVTATSTTRADVAEAVQLPGLVGRHT